MGQSESGGQAGAVAANLAHAKFLFVTARADSEAYRAKLRTAGANIARGFFNDFDIDDSRETQAQALESIQFYVRDEDLADPLPSCVGPRIDLARHVVQVSGKYRPRLREIGDELRRRIGDQADVVALDGALRGQRYSSPEMVQYSTKDAPPRRSGRISRNAIILPIRKTPDWWQKSVLDRNTFFYPHVDHARAWPVKGHALAAEPAIPFLFRRLYHNPDGYQRPDEFDFITYFECEDDGLPVFDRVLKSLRDIQQNPEWRHVEEGPIWRGKRVHRW